jgi:hypothetical protein
MDVLYFLLDIQFAGLMILFLLVYLQNRIYDRPKKILKHSFSQVFKIAVASKKYKTINLLKKRGLLTEKEYEKRLKKILPLIDISSVIDVIRTDEGSYKRR